MQADPDDQRRLLDLQQADTALTQLAHRRAHLPVEKEIAEVTKELNTVTDRRAAHEATASDLERDIARVEREIDQVRARADKDRRLQESGSVGPRELEGLSRELETLARRQSDLEDQELELMERRESETSSAAVSAAEASELSGRLSELTTDRDRVVADLDMQTSVQQKARIAVASSLPEDLIALYEKIRKSNPTAAAMLRQRRCEGCRIEQSGGELAELRAADPSDVVRCDNCRAILVRTEESGL
ncbi:zinc ribbon domain-containing protein [Stackebrandtia soli]|uniref:zinc ribbon domain-containing protein n=1 Tax=Stackebrandtia soli TaxID=1892856 RepID=UPI0039EB7EF3